MTDDMELDGQSVPADAEILEAVTKARALYDALKAATEKYDQANRDYMAAQAVVIGLLRGSSESGLERYAGLGGGYAGPRAGRVLGGPS
ncbi:hypothetical protein [Hyphomonas sp.]|uniref:hypothetical protein n=1 Tax=Hyphomonas sp. TaxID=87 RepID=UPI0030035B57